MLAGIIYVLVINLAFSLPALFESASDRKEKAYDRFIEQRIIVCEVTAERYTKRGGSLTGNDREANGLMSRFLRGRRNDLKRKMLLEHIPLSVQAVNSFLDREFCEYQKRGC